MSPNTAPVVVRIADVPAVTADQMREVDRIMVEEMHINLIQMMENAGRNLAELAISLFTPSTALILAGPGGNGGGGLAAARHLSNRGVDVRVTLARSSGEMAPVTAHQLDILQRMKVPVSDDASTADLIIDALIGYSLRGNPRGGTAKLIEWTRSQNRPVLALDTPSGLDVTTGHPATATVRATATLTLALPKVGLLHASGYVGDLYLGDISVPPLVYEYLGIQVPLLFGAGAIVALKGEIPDSR